MQSPELGCQGEPSGFLLETNAIHRQRWSVHRKPINPQPTLFTMPVMTAYNRTCGRHFAYQCNSFGIY